MTKIHKELIALFGRSPGLVNGLDRGVSYIVKVTPNGERDYAIDTHLQVTPQLEEGDTSGKLVQLDAAKFNYTNEPEELVVEVDVDEPGSKARLLFGSTLKRFDTAAPDGCFWFHYQDGEFTAIEKGLVYVSSKLIQTHILKITVISTTPSQKLHAVISPAQLERCGRIAKRA